MTADEIAEQERRGKQQAEAIADRERAIALSERQEKLQERTAKEQAEAIALQANLAQQQAEALLKKYRDRFGDITE